MNPNNEHDRVRRNTSPKVLDRVDERVSASVCFYATQPADAIRRRIHELEEEWDVERVLETNASTLALVGVALAATIDRRWLLLSGGVLGFLFMHAVKGWCPPLPLLRRLGIRTQTEIDREKFALKVLRGDLRSRHLRSTQESAARIDPRSGRSLVAAPAAAVRRVTNFPPEVRQGGQLFLPLRSAWK